LRASVAGAGGGGQQAVVDAAKLEIANNKDANKWVKPAFRKGWEIKL
jgi:hypothetical protein